MEKFITVKESDFVELQKKAEQNEPKKIIFSLQGVRNWTPWESEMYTVRVDNYLGDKEEKIIVSSVLSRLKPYFDSNQQIANETNDRYEKMDKLYQEHLNVPSWIRKLFRQGKTNSITKPKY